MERIIRFRLNEAERELTLRGERLALDWIREDAGLKGTKEGCREGDCGACLVLLGEPKPDGTGVEWLTATSCTLGLGDLDGRHIVTIEGLAAAGLTPVMRAMLDAGASQCGFCSPGFVIAFTGFLVAARRIDAGAALAEVEGNLCRCTGYGAMRRVAESLEREFSDLPEGQAERLVALAERGVIPGPLAALMVSLPAPALGGDAHESGSRETMLGGGTDYFVQHPDADPDLEAHYADRDPSARRIASIVEGARAWLAVGPAVTIHEFFAAPETRELWPELAGFERDVASPPIRNRATLVGNIVNASPVADMTSMLIALGAELSLRDAAGRERLVALEDFFLAYKKIDLRPGERIACVRIPAKRARFNFEKGAKRARLDIATANTACAVALDEEGRIAWARFSAGGLGPTPMRLAGVESIVAGKCPSASLAREAGLAARESVKPIGDVRGSAGYRSSLAERLVWGHFLRLWPELSRELLG